MGKRKELDLRSRETGCWQEAPAHKTARLRIQEVFGEGREFKSKELG